MSKKDNELLPSVFWLTDAYFEAYFGVSALQGRIFALCLSEFQRKLPQEEKGLLICKISASKFRKHIGNNNQCNSETIGQELDAISNTNVKIHKGKSYAKGYLIAHYVYDSDTDIFTIYAMTDMYERIRDINENASDLYFDVFDQFQCSYAQRLYQKFRHISIINNPVVYSISIKELREYLALDIIFPDGEESHKYTDYGSLNKYVIKRSINEINKVGQMKIEVGPPTKQGTKIIGLNFIITDYKPKTPYQSIPDGVLEIGSSKTGIVVSSKPIVDASSSKQSIKSIKKEDVEQLKLFEEPSISSTVPKKKTGNENSLPSGIALTQPLIPLFKIDFPQYDFNDRNQLRMFLKAQAIILEKTNAAELTTENYDDFVELLNNQAIK